MRRATLVILCGVIIALVAGSWAVPGSGAAHLFPGLPRAVRFHEAEGRGILVKTWINNRGPFTFAVDTGAGLTVVSENVAQQAAVTRRPGRTIVAGLSGRQTSVISGVVSGIAIGWEDNHLPATQVRVGISPSLPAGIDGILDPSDAYSPFGFSIDLPERLIAPINPETEPLNTRRPPVDGAIVPWLRDGQTKRPFVRLSDGRLALIDTGSSFGLAVTRAGTLQDRDRRQHVSDISGGTIGAIRIAPTTVRIGALVLENVPTDLLDGVEKAPVILGRDALYPFRLSFDPRARLIEIVPATK
ncbi:MAG TPA: retroviral-like aspartic protease family protein [Pyrinomonadaceae bacterium]|nr:retroviral-like aspartic protease family protein [Pyrinomonadaceae bacterium]